MEEKVLIKSQQYNCKKLFRIIIIAGIILTLLISSVLFIELLIEEYNNVWEENGKIYREHKENIRYWESCSCSSCEFVILGPNRFDYAFSCFFVPETLLICFIPTIASIVIFGITYCLLCTYSLTVTSKRVYGKILFGKRVDLPIDSISAIGITPLLKGISISTSSGRIVFNFIKNSNKIYDILNDLLIKRQKGHKSHSVTDEIDEIDKIKKLKELLDSGIITQEEFDAKKKQLLGL